MKKILLFLLLLSASSFSDLVWGMEDRDKYDLHFTEKNKKTSCKKPADMPIGIPASRGRFENHRSLQSYFRETHLAKDNLEAKYRAGGIYIEIDPTTRPNYLSDGRKEFNEPCQWPQSVHGLVRALFE